VAATGYGWSGSVVEEEDELVGQTLNGTYVIERILGEGGMGRVYLARHTRIQRKRFAIKSLHPEYVRRADVVKRFRREAEAAAAIASEHVVGVYDVDEDELGRPYIVAELLEGVELGDLLDEEGRLPVPRAVRIVRQICRALTAAHTQGVVHRDMKPENVFLCGDPQAPTAKVLDFGISRLDDGGEGTNLTKAGTVMGTPAFMPPEQARGTRVDHRADIYSVGAILYRAVTGKLPFDRDDPMATVAAVLTEEPPRPRSLAPDVPEGLEIVIQRAMAKDADARFPAMAELDAALAPYDAATAAITTPSPTQRFRTGGRTELVVLLSVAGAFGLFGLLGAGASAVTLARGYGPTATELAVVALTVGLGLTTPMVLGILRLRRTVWEDSARVEALVTILRRPIGSALAVYAAGWLVSSMTDVVFSGRPGWAGWPLIWFVAALAAALYGRLLRGAQHARDLAVGAGAVTVVTILSAMIRGGSAAPIPSAITPATSAAPAASVPPASAPAAALASAKAKGVDGLEALREDYPRDPAVLRMLLIAHAATPSGLERAMELVDELHAIDPRALNDPLIEQAILEAASLPGPARQRALAALAERMGSRGPDLLWDLAHGNSGAKGPAAELLAQPEVQARGTPALQVAVALDNASTCADKAELLGRVRQQGDERSVKVLRPLTVGTSRGCGFLSLAACPAPCRKEAAKMKEAIAEVEQRTAK
jgi:serine/threonine-protein kinase